jgi:peptidoglycan/LPS O-acetylase OafA/YrhL
MAFRPDIQGLRAVAIGAVLLAHAGVPFAAGGFVGVDVFFVISGFLITGMLVRELERTGKVSLGRFYARRVKRLMPLALTVLAVTVIAAFALLSPLGAVDVSGDVIAAGVYAVNWKFAAESVDYFAEGAGESPLQHYWSLAVEEQFYLVWPALLLAGTVWWRRRGRTLERVLPVLLGSVFAGSLAYAVHLSAAAPERAYFSTFARVWELALGGLLALALARWCPGRRPAAALGWAGAAGIVYATVTFDGHSALPGPAALVPTLGAAALIAAGAGGRRPLPIRWLVTRPLQHVGAVSYAWYLWHWPALIFAAGAWGPLSVWQGLTVVALSYLPTLWSHVYIEEPLRHSRIDARRPRMALVGAPAAAAAAVALGAGLSLLVPSTPLLAADKADGAERLQRDRGLQRSADALRPNPRRADQDRGRVHEDGCLVPFRRTQLRSCVYAVKDAPTRLVLFGDSHAMQHFPALERVAVRRGWRLEVLTKAACPPSTMRVYNRHLARRYTECERWRESALRRIAAVRPAVVVTGSSTFYPSLDGGRRLDPEASLPAFAAGYAVVLRRLRALTDRVLVLRDTPRPTLDPPECVSEHVKNLRACAFPRRAAFARPQPERAAVRRVQGNVRMLDATSRFCLRRLCPSVIGDVLVYRRSAHITATYSRTMARWFERRLPMP